MMTCTKFIGYQNLDKKTTELLNLPSVPFGVLSYLMAMGGIMLIVAELLIGPGTFYKPIVFVTAAAVMIPILFHRLLQCMHKFER